MTNDVMTRWFRAVIERWEREDRPGEYGERTVSFRWRLCWFLMVMGFWVRDPYRHYASRFKNHRWNWRFWYAPVPVYQHGTVVGWCNYRGENVWGHFVWLLGGTAPPPREGPFRPCRAPSDAASRPSPWDGI